MAPVHWRDWVEKKWCFHSLCKKMKASTSSLHEKLCFKIAQISVRGNRKRGVWGGEEALQFREKQQTLMRRTDVSIFNGCECNFLLNKFFNLFGNLGVNYVKYTLLCHTDLLCK